MERHKFSLLGLGLALLYWFGESVIHRFIYAEEFFEVMPSDVNEFWMRLLIIVLIIGFGFFADNRARKIKRTEREKHQVYVATVRSTQHILNNLMNQMHREGKQQVERLSSVSNISSESIEDSVKPT